MAIVQHYGIGGLTVATMMAGVILIVLGIAKLGGAIKFIPAPVMTGFTSGIAVIIFSGELRDFFGLKIDSVPAEFIAKIQRIRAALRQCDIRGPWPLRHSRSASSCIGRAFPLKVPAPFVALIADDGLMQVRIPPGETIGSRLARSMRRFPCRIGHGRLHDLVAARRASVHDRDARRNRVAPVGRRCRRDDRHRHRSNMELVAQGIANVVTPLFGGIPATGAIARTATNIKSGGRTPVAGMVHSVTLLLITLFLDDGRR